MPRESYSLPRGILIRHAAPPPNPPRFSCAYPFLIHFLGQFWRPSGIQNGSYSISSDSSRRLLSNDIKFAWIGVRMWELWLPEVGVPELFLRVFPAKIPVKRGKPPANRELHVVAEVFIFPTHPGSAREGSFPREKRVKSSAHFSLLFVCVRARIWPTSRRRFLTFFVPSESLRYPLP